MDRQRIKLKGRLKEHFGDVPDLYLFEGGPIATMHQFENFNVGYAHLFESGNVMSYGVVIGTKDDLVLLEETE